MINLNFEIFGNNRVFFLLCVLKGGGDWVGTGNLFNLGTEG